MLVDFGSVFAMTAAGIAYKDSLLLDPVSALSMGTAWIDGVLVVKASAGRVAFDDLIAHIGVYELTVKVRWKWKVA
jgi:hypothetical protein